MREAVLRAAREELVEHGYGGFRIERVAERAKVHKTTLYRQWGSRTALAKEAIAEWQRELITPIDTGAWESDLRALFLQLAGLFTSDVSQALLRTLVVANVSDPELTKSLHEVWRDDAAALMEPIIRAQQSGEVAAHLDPRAIIAMMTGPLIQRTVVSSMPVDEAFVDALVTIILAGTEPRRTGRLRAIRP